MKRDTRITLAQAMDWAKRWRADEKNKVIGHRIPKESMTDLLKEDLVDGARVYMGIDEDGMHKLMFVAVDKEERDLLDANAQHYIYDFTAPCPTTCDITSPLYEIRQ